MDRPVTHALLERLPKAELHCHLDGSVRPETLLELGREYRVPMPRDDPDALREFMIVRDARSLEDYLARFATTLSVMQSAEALERIAYELAEDSWRENIRYLEVRFDPSLSTRRGLSAAGVVDAIVRGLRRAEQDHGVIGRMLVTALRTEPPERSLELARLAVERRDAGVAGFDLAGAERGFPASAHHDAFHYARTHDLACTCHAGEGDGAPSVREAVHECGANRIGHGTRLFEDPSLATYVNDRRIPLEVCLTSNVQTHAVASYATHPLRRYFDDGMMVVLGTDNRLMSGISLTDEYEHAARHLHFSFDELCKIAMNGFASGFLPWAQRRALMADADREMQRLATEAA